MSGEAPVSEAPRARAEGQRASRTTLRPVASSDPAQRPPVAFGPGDEPRMMLHAVTVTVSDARASVSVEVRVGGDQSVAVAEGACAAGGVERLVADATVRAVAGLDPAAASIALDAVSVATLGGRTVATVTLAQPLGAAEEPLAGAAVVGPAGTVDAVARAVLDALSRRSPRA